MKRVGRPARLLVQAVQAALALLVAFVVVAAASTWLLTFGPPLGNGLTLLLALAVAVAVGYVVGGRLVASVRWQPLPASGFPRLSWWAVALVTGALLLLSWTTPQLVGIVLFEEMLFRGLPLVILWVVTRRRGAGSAPGGRHVWAVGAVSSLAFLAAHGAQTFPVAGNRLAFGIVLFIVGYLTGQLAMPLILHLCSNALWDELGGSHPPEMLHVVDAVLLVVALLVAVRFRSAPAGVDVDPAHGPTHAERESAR